MHRRAVYCHSVLFLLGNILPQFSGLFFLPLLTYYLSPAEFGSLEILNRFGELFVICLFFNGLRQFIIVFYGQVSPMEPLCNFATPLLIVVFGLFLSGLFLGCLFLPVTQLVFPGIEAWLSILSLISLLVEASYTLFLCLAQVRMQSGVFIICVCLQIVCRLFFCVLFLCCFHFGLFGVILSSLISSSILFLLLVIREFPNYSLNCSYTSVKSMVCFALPFVPAGLGFFILNHGDRFLLFQFSGGATVGVYSLGYKVALAVSMFTRAPLMMVWGPRVYRLSALPHAPSLFGKIFVWILGCYVFVGLGCCVFQDDIIWALGSNAYSGASLVIGPVVLAYFFLTAADFMDCAFYVRRKTIHKSVVALATTVVMSLGYLFLIPSLSILGATLATLFGFVFHAVLTYFVSRSLFFVQYPFLRIFYILGLAVLFWFFSRYLPFSMMGIILKLVLMSGWITLIWFLGLISSEEKSEIICFVLRGAKLVSTYTSISSIALFRSR